MARILMEIRFLLVMILFIGALQGVTARARHHSNRLLSRIHDPIETETTNVARIRQRYQFPQVNESDVLKVNESVAYTGYRTMLHRDVLLPNGRTVRYDILDQHHLSVVVFVWNTSSNSTTLIREYHPGAERFHYGVVAGMYEESKHLSALEAAQFELEEEAQLQSKFWYPLLATPDTSMPFDKYSTNRFFPFLAIDCTAVIEPRPMDEEELITVEHGVPYSRLKDLMLRGEVNVVSTYTTLLAVEKLRELGIASLN